MDIFTQQIINGLVLGSIYALVALGYTMVYGILELINFAHGEVTMFGAMICLAVMSALLGAGVDLPGLMIVQRNRSVTGSVTGGSVTGDRPRFPEVMDAGGAGQELQADGTAIRGGYRAEPCGFLSGPYLSPSVSPRAIVSTGAPVSTAVELETLVISAFRNFFGSRRNGLVSISGFCSIGEL